MNFSILNFPDYECDDFVRGKTDAKLCQMPAWINNMVEKVFGHKGFYLVAREGGTFCSALPLTHVRSRLFGSRMISQAFSNYGGPLAKSPVVSNALCRCAVELAEKIHYPWGKPNLCRKIGRAAHEKALREYSPEKVYERLMSVYEKAIELKPGGANVGF